MRRLSEPISIRHVIPPLTCCVLLINRALIFGVGMVYSLDGVFPAGARQLRRLRVQLDIENGLLFYVFYYVLKPRHNPPGASTQQSCCHVPSHTRPEAYLCPEVVMCVIFFIYVWVGGWSCSPYETSTLDAMTYRNPCSQSGSRNTKQTTRMASTWRLPLFTHVVDFVEISSQCRHGTLHPSPPSSKNS